MGLPTTQTTHTPGPWRLDNSAEYTEQGVFGIEQDEEQIIAAVFVDNLPITGPANARLIAAAPDLLAALIRLTCEAERRAGVPKAEIAAARATIYKAEGKE